MALEHKLQADEESMRLRAQVSKEKTVEEVTKDEKTFDLANLQPHHVLTSEADTYTNFRKVAEGKNIFIASSAARKEDVFIDVKDITKRKDKETFETQSKLKNISNEYIVAHLDSFMRCVDGKIYGVMVAQKLTDFQTKFSKMNSSQLRKVIDHSMKALVFLQAQ